MRLTPVRAGHGVCVVEPSLWVSITTSLGAPTLRPSSADDNGRMVASMSTLAADATACSVHADGPAAHITLNRPDKRNALSLELMQDLTARCGA